MNVNQLLADDRAVSPVVGVAILIAITVILAAVIGGVVLGLNTESAESPQASLQFEYNDTSTDLTIRHTGGESLDSDHVVVRGQAVDDGSGTFSSEVDLPRDLDAGQSAVVQADTINQEVSVVWQDPNSKEESVVGKHEIEP